MGWQKIVQNTATSDYQNFPQRPIKTSPIPRENRGTGNTDLSAQQRLTLNPTPTRAPGPVFMMLLQLRLLLRLLIISASALIAKDSYSICPYRIPGFWTLLHAGHSIPGVIKVSTVIDHFCLVKYFVPLFMNFCLHRFWYFNPI